MVVLVHEDSVVNDADIEYDAPVVLPATGRSLVTEKLPEPGPVSVAPRFSVGVRPHAAAKRQETTTRAARERIGPDASVGGGCRGVGTTVVGLDRDPAERAVSAERSQKSLARGVAHAGELVLCRRAFAQRQALRLCDRDVGVAAKDGRIRAVAFAVGGVYEATTIRFAAEAAYGEGASVGTKHLLALAAGGVRKLGVIIATRVRVRFLAHPGVTAQADAGIATDEQTHHHDSRTHPSLLAPL
jgi:hypothetical protein